jgi:hypothetical protein
MVKTITQKTKGKVKERSKYAQPTKIKKREKASLFCGKKLFNQ